MMMTSSCQVSLGRRHREEAGWPGGRCGAAAASYEGQGSWEEGARAAGSSPWAPAGRCPHCKGMCALSDCDAMCTLQQAMVASDDFPALMQHHSGSCQRAAAWSSLCRGTFLLPLNPLQLHVSKFGDMSYNQLDQHIWLGRPSSTIEILKYQQLQMDCGPAD